MADVNPKLHRPYRWAVLLAYVGVMAVQQMLWLNFAPLLGLVQPRYGVSELMASTLVLVFPLLYVFLSLPAGALIDRRGYRFGVGVGIVATAAFSVLRLLDAASGRCWPGRWASRWRSRTWSTASPSWWPTGSTRSRARWPRGWAPWACSWAWRWAWPPRRPLVPRYGLRGAMAVFFGIATFAAVFFVLAARDNHPPATPAAATPTRFRPVLKVRASADPVVAAWASAPSTVSPPGSRPSSRRRVRRGKAGLVGGVFIAGGIFGAVLVPLASDLLKRRKPFLILCAALAAVAMAVVGTEHDYGMLLGVGAALGFVLLPAFALLLDMSAILAGAAHAGAASGLIMLFGNAGGVVGILLVPAVRALGVSYGVVVAMLAGLLSLGAVFALLPPETFPGAAAAAARAPAAGRRANEARS